MKLNDELSDHFRLTATQKKALAKLHITTVQDLLFHLPSRYVNIGDTRLVRDLVSGESAILYGTISGLKTKKTFKSRIPAAEGYFSDSTGRIKIMWFNQPYIAKMYPEGSKVRVSGKVGGKQSLYLSNPEIEAVDALPDDIHTSLFKDGKRTDLLYPIYPESRGITSKWMYHAIQKIFAQDILEQIHDPLEETILKKYSLPTRKTALVWVHTPKKEKDAEAARKRFAFEEVFFIQLYKQQERHEWSERKTLSIELEQQDIDKFIKRFPFTLTKSQQRSIEQIVHDLKRSFPMSRLLEGDVGSGKTAVAAATMYAAVMTHPDGKDYGNLQTAYMCPTEILAKQHFESFMELFSHLPVNIGLITGSGCKRSPFSSARTHSSKKRSRSRILLTSLLMNSIVLARHSDKSWCAKTVSRRTCYP